MTTFEVREAIKVKDVPGRNGGTVPIYKLTLWADGQSREAELFDNRGLNPQPGQKVTGAIEPSEYGLKFRPANTGGGGGGGGARRPSDPRERASIEAQVALKSAVEYAGHLAQAGRLADDFNAQSVTQVADLFYACIHSKTQEVTSA